jgi:hypothetical protein
VAQDTPDAIAQGAGTAMTDDELRGEINKRLTLNWLIQGAAQHAGMTFHHLVRDELDALDPRLLLLYDQYALINLLQYWQVEGVLLLGWPPWFWRRAGSNPRHPFFEHPLLSRFGGILAAAAKTPRSGSVQRKAGDTHSGFICISDAKSSCSPQSDRSTPSTKTGRVGQEIGVNYLGNSD